MIGYSLKEYGGCLPIEKYKRVGTNPFIKSDRLECATGRECIYRACMIAKKKRILIPLYLCPYVKEYLEQKGIIVEEYNIDDRFSPIVKWFSEYMLLWTRYFGISNVTVQNELLKLWPKNQIIFDNTQALFFEPVDGSYNVYSLRKFIGIPDGAYLIGPGAHLYDSVYTNDISWEYLRNAASSPDRAYRGYLSNEEGLTKRRGMGIVTRDFLNTVDFDRIRNIRRKNISKMHDILGKLNEFQIYDERDMVCYPFLRKSNEFLRPVLLDNKIFTPMWWKRILFDERANDYERYLTRNLIPIPIDQRYSVNDVESVARFIAELC